MKTSVGERGPVTAPKILKDRLGIKPGVTLEFRTGTACWREELPAKVYDCPGRKFSTEAFMADFQ
jgi:hypothetical protein